MAETDVKHEYDDEIELMDILLVLWKKKIFIITGTLVCMILATIVSFILPKIYQVQMKIRPGYAESGNGYKEKLAYIKGKLAYIKGTIDANVYDEAIVKELSVPGLKQIPDEIDFKISIPENSETLNVLLDVSDVESGKKILQNLYSLISQEDEIKMKQMIDEHDQAIRLEKIKLDENNAHIKSKLFELGIIDQRIVALDSMAVDAKANNEILIIEQKKLLALSGKNDENSLSALLYTNTIQGNLLMINSLMNEKNVKLQRKQAVKSAMDLLAINSKTIKETILKSENLRNQIRKMIMLSPPKASEYPIKPKKKMIVVLAGIAGLFFMLLSAFILEYVSKFNETAKAD